MIFERQHTPQLIAHKGNSWDEPENTVASVRSALLAGADVVELDVSASKDLVPMVIHGPSLEESTSGAGRVRSASAEAIGRLFARDRDGAITSHTVPTLAQVLDEFGASARFNIDLKDESVVAPAIREVEQRGLTSRCVVSGSTVRRAKRVLREADHLAVLIDLNRLDKLVAATRLRVPWLAWRYRSAPDDLRVLALNIQARYVDRALVDRIHGLGGEVWTYTVDDQAAVDALLAAGVDSVTTNKPGVIRVR